MSALPTFFLRSALVCVALVCASSAPGQTNIGAWGVNGNGQTDIPSGLAPILRVSAGARHSLALLTNKQIVAWGDNSSGQCSVPAGATNFTAIAAGGDFSIALRNNGTLTVWGGSSFVQTLPTGGTPTAIAAGSFDHAVAAYVSGSATSRGTTGRGASANTTVTLGSVTALAAGSDHNVALLPNGTVRSWWAASPFLSAGFTSVTNVPAGLSNVIAIAAGDYHTLALRSNGTVVAWGFNESGQTNVPVELTNAVAIAAGGGQSMAVTSSGKVVIWGIPPTDLADFSQRIAPPDLTNVVAIAASGGHVLILTTNPIPCVTQPPRSRMVPTNWPVTFKIAASGQEPFSYQWQLNSTNLPAGTNATITVSSLQDSDLGNYRVMVTNPFGSTTSRVANLVSGSALAWGLNSGEQCWLHPRFTNAVRLAGGSFTTHAVGADGKISVAGILNYTNQFAALQSTTDAASIASAGQGQLVIRSNRTLLALGDLGSNTPVPPEATNVISASVAVVGSGGVAVREDGRVIAWSSGPLTITNIPASLTNAVSATAGFDAGFAITREGGVSGFGNSNRTNTPSSLLDAVAVAVTVLGNTPYALRSDGTVVTWSSSAVLSAVNGATNAVALAAGLGHLLVLRTDGTVFVTGNNQYGQGTLPGTLSNVVEVAAGNYHSIVRFGDGSPRITIDPYSRSIHSGSNTTLTAFGVGSQPLAYQWQINGTNISNATNASYVLTNAVLGSIGGYACIVTNAMGAVTSAVASVSVVFDPPQFTLLNPPPIFGPEGFSVRVESLSGAGPVVIFASTNLADWQPILTNTGGSVQFDFLDPVATNQPMRFYKASEQR